MKKLYSLILSLFLIGLVILPSLSYGQKAAKLTKGSLTKMKVKENWSDVTPLGNDQRYTYYLLSSYADLAGNGIYIGDKDTYLGKVENATMELVQHTPMKLEYQGKELDLQFGAEINNTAYIFTSFQNKKLEKSFLFAHKINKQTLTLEKPVPVAEVSYAEFKKAKTTSFSYTKSPDGKKILFTHHVFNKDGWLLGFGYTITDTKFGHQKVAKNLQLPSQGIYNIQKFEVSDKGDVYVLARFFANKKLYKKSVDTKKQGFMSSNSMVIEKPNYKYKILKINSNGTDGGNITLNVPKHFITSVNLVPTSDAGLLCMGFVSNDEDAVPDAAFAQHINSKLQVTNTDNKSLQGKFEQPSKFSDSTYRAPGIFAKKTDLSHFYFGLKDIIKKASGEYVLSAERTAKILVTQRSGNTITTYTVYHTDDIAVIDASPNGQIKWIQKINKGQQGYSTYVFYEGYKLFHDHNKLSIFYTNIYPKNSRAFGKLDDTKAQLVTIDADGKSKEETIFSTNDTELTLRAENTYRLSDDSYIFYGQDGKMTSGFIKATLR